MGETVDLSDVKLATRVGYIFKGWYTSKDGNTKMPSSVKLTDGGVTYYAQWTANAQSKISPHHGKNINGSKSKLPKYGGTKIKSIFGFRINVDWFSCRIIWWIKKIQKK